MPINVYKYLTEGMQKIDILFKAKKKKKEIHLNNLKNYMYRFLDKYKIHIKYTGVHFLYVCVPILSWRSQIPEET